MEEMNSKPGRGDAGQGRTRREREGREQGICVDQTWLPGRQCRWGRTFKAAEKTKG